jgi:hypothetical protein
MRLNLWLSIGLFVGTFAYGLYDMGATPEWARAYAWPLALTGALMIWCYNIAGEEGAHSGEQDTDL